MRQYVDRSLRKRRRVFQVLQSHVRQSCACIHGTSIVIEKVLDPFNELRNQRLQRLVKHSKDSKKQSAGI